MCFSFEDSIWGADPVYAIGFYLEIQFLYVINIFSKYILVVTLQDKKCIIITNLSKSFR